MSGRGYAASASLRLCAQWGRARLRRSRGHVVEMDYAVNEAKAEHAQNILRQAPHVSARALKGQQFVNRACTLNLGQKIRVKNPSPGCLGGGLGWGQAVLNVC